MTPKNTFLKADSSATSRGLRLCALALTVVLSNVTSPAQSNTAEVVAAANAFLATLSPAQSNAVVYAPTLANAGNWSNVPIDEATRNGPQLFTLSPAQRTAARDVAVAALSPTGTNLFEEIRLMDNFLVSINPAKYNYDFYYIAFVGVPSTNSLWLLQLCGHHISYNITFNGTYPGSTPMFVGTEPNRWTNGTVVHSALNPQISAILALRQTLTTAALLSGTYTEVVFGANGPGSHDTIFPKAYPTTGRGQLYTTLSPAQQALVKDFIEAYVNTMASDVATNLLADYESDAALAQTYVGYSGNSTNMSTLNSYFRVDGPRVWAEFSVRLGAAYPSIPHWHSIWRDKLTDYGAAFGTNTISTPNRLPTITNQPASQAIELGSNVTFSVAATGPGTLYYQWYKNAAAISGATNTLYSIASVVATNAGNYSVKVWNYMGHRTSATATLTTIGNTPPTLNPVSNLAINPGQFLSLTNTATDPDLPAQSFLFSLLAGPTNVALDPDSGVLAWRPLIAQADSTNDFSVSVTDNGSPVLSATQSFSVIVAAAIAPSNTAVAYADGRFELLVSGQVGPDYVIQASTNLVNWESLNTTNPVVMPLNWIDANASNYPARFFRVLLGP